MANIVPQVFTRSYEQQHPHPASAVFPLLCPVREADWLADWQYDMIHSKSGLVENNCVFTTPHHGEHPTVWMVTEYDPTLYQLGFVRVTPGEMLVRIHIKVEDRIQQAASTSHITYRYTPLQAKVAQDLYKNLDKDWEDMMTYWEKAINHYLATGEQL